MSAKKTTTSAEDVQKRLLACFQILRLPVSGDDLSRALHKAEAEGLSHLAFLETLIGDQANRRRERSIERRIREAGFREKKLLEDFDWNFNKGHIDRLQMEELGTADFVRRRDDVIFVGQSGIGKSHLIQALGIRACVAGYSVRYVASGALIAKLTASIADHTLPKVIRWHTRPNLLIIDEFGFDKLERAESPDAASLLYKVIDGRHHKGSTALVTNIEFDAWGSYLGDMTLSMALIDRLVETAVIVRFPSKTRSWRQAQAEKRKAARGGSKPSSS